MKNLKKILALVTALALTLALALPAFAADGDEQTGDVGDTTVNTDTTSAQPTQQQVEVDGTTITVDGVKINLPTVEVGQTTPDMKDHTFKGYQIFKAKYNEDDDFIYSIEWGDGIKADEFLTALKDSSDFGETNPFAEIEYTQNGTNGANTYNESAYAVATVVAGWESDMGTGTTSYAKTFAEIADRYITNTSYDEGNTLAAGYYLVVDETNVANGENAVRNLSVLNMVTDGQFNPQTKVNVPQMVKQVYEKNDSDATLNDWALVADYDIGDEIPYTLTGSLPTDYGDYETYKYVFHDTLDTGLTLNQSSIHVYVKNGDTTVEIPAANYVVSVDGQTFSVAFNDLKTIKDNDQNAIETTAASQVQVFYTATLNADAITSNLGNANTAHLEFSNNPNATGEGNNRPTGTTPNKKVTVFTFELDFDKVDEQGANLPGAGFTLYKWDANATDAGDYVEVGTLVQGSNDEATDSKYEFEFKGLDAGQYKLVETIVPSGYNKAADMFFTITATYDDKDPASITSLTISDVKDADDNVIVAGNTQGIVEGSNVDNTNGDGVTVTLNIGTLDTKIMNLRGLTLPSTGGIGTTIFYVVGGLLVLGAGVLLITKKRMGRSE